MVLKGKVFKNCERVKTMELAPVYDCGSCLYAQADENIMKRVLTDEKEKTTEFMRLLILLRFFQTCKKNSTK